MEDGHLRLSDFDLVGRGGSISVVSGLKVSKDTVDSLLILLRKHTLPRSDSMSKSKSLGVVTPIS
jgi:hypothetical protein